MRGTWIKHTRTGSGTIILLLVLIACTAPGSCRADGTAEVDSLDFVAAGDTGVFSFRHPPLYRIDVTAAADIADVLLAVEEAPAPSGAGAPDGVVFRYVRLTTYRVPPECIAMATIRFRIPLSWFGEQQASAESTAVYRYDEECEEWKLLSTVPDGEEDNYADFFADTPGFGYFAITATAGSIPDTPEAIGEQEPPDDISAPVGSVNVKTPEPAAPLQEVPSQPPHPIQGIFIIALVLGIVALGLLYHRDA